MKNGKVTEQSLMNRKSHLWLGKTYSNKNRANKKTQMFRRNKLLIAMLLLPYLEPSGIEDMSGYLGGIYYLIDKIFTALTLVSCMIIIIMYLSEKRIKVSPVLYLIFWFLLVQIFSAAYNSNLTLGYITTALKIFGLCLLVNLYMQTVFKKDFLETLCLILEVLILLNFFSMLLWPQGMYRDDRNWTQNWILGYKNRHIYYYIPYMSVKAICQYLKKARFNITFYLMYIIVLIGAIRADSSTSLVCVLVFGICLLFFRNRNLPKVINPFFIMIISGVLTFVFVGLGYISKYLSVFNNLFNKNTVYRRTLVWNASLRYISRSPVIGLGNFKFDLSTYTWTITQAHNEFIDLLLTGGIILLFVFFVIFYVITQRMEKISNPIFRNIMIGAFIPYGILFLMEAKRNNYMLFMMFVLAYYTNEVSMLLDKEKKTNKELYRNLTRRKRIRISL